MTAKEQIIKMLRFDLIKFEYEKDYHIKLGAEENDIGILSLNRLIESKRNLITATEQAIFEVPSEEEIESELAAATIEQEIGFNACLKLFKYKPETRL